MLSDVLLDVGERAVQGVLDPVALSSEITSIPRFHNSGGR
jgi:hypothetical protein